MNDSGILVVHLPSALNLECQPDMRRAFDIQLCSISDILQCPRALLSHFIPFFKVHIMYRNTHTSSKWSLQALVRHSRNSSLLL